MRLRLFSSLIVLTVCVLGMGVSILSNSAYGIATSLDPQNNFSYFITDIDKNVKTLAISGKDNSGNSFTIDLILNKDMIGMHQMMMQHMSMMGNMGGMMNSSSTGGMGNMSGMMNKVNNTAMQYCPCIQMMKFMQNQYVVEGGMIVIGSSTYLIDSGSARIVDDKIFLNVHPGSLKSGKIILYGKLNQDQGLKGISSIPEMRNISKITGTGILTNAFQ